MLGPASGAAIGAKGERMRLWCLLAIATDPKRGPFAASPGQQRWGCRPEAARAPCQARSLCPSALLTCAVRITSSSLALPCPTRGRGDPKARVACRTPRPTGVLSWDQARPRQADCTRTPLNRSAPKSLICKHFASPRNEISGFSLGRDIHRLNINSDGDAPENCPHAVGERCGQIRGWRQFSTVRPI